MILQRNPASAIDAFKSETAVRSLVMIHSNIQSQRTFAALGFDWLVMIAMIASAQIVAAKVSSSYLVAGYYTFAVIVIACRQHALLVIMHEAAHFRISKNLKLNDFIGEMLAAFPTMSTLTGYRKHHIQHHRTTNTDQDPDWARKLFLPDWQYPQDSKTIARVFAKQFYRGGLDWCRFMFMIGRSDRKRIAFWAGALGAAYLGNVFGEFLMYWMVPLWCVFPFIQRIRSTSEHFGLPNEHEFNGTRNTMAGPIETFLFSPHDVNMHLTHHLFPSVPFYNLRKLHDELLKFETYAKLGYTNDSFLFGPRSVLADLRTQGTHKPTIAISTKEKPAA